MAAVIEFIGTPLFKYLMIALVVAGLLFKVYSMGEEHTQAQWDAAKAETIKEIAALKEKAGKVTVQTETVYVDKIKTVYVKGDAITQYVDRYITAADDAKCVIPDNFVVLLNSAAKNVVPQVEGAKK